MKLMKQTLAVFVTLLLVWGCGRQQMPLSTKSEQAKALLQQALTRMENYENAKARELLQQAIQADSGFALPYLYAAMLSQDPAERKANYAKANELAKKASYPERKFIRIMSSPQKNVEQAITSLAKLAHQYRKDRHLQIAMAQLYYAQGNYDKAIEGLTRAIQLDSTTVNAFYRLGEAYLMKNEFARARQYFQKALAVTPAEASTTRQYYSIAITYLYEGNVDSALAVLQRGAEDYLARNPNGVPVFFWNSIGRINLENGRLQEAMKCYEKGYSYVEKSSMDETQKQIWLGRLHHGEGRIYAKMGKFKQAWHEANTIKKMIEGGGAQAKNFWPSYYYLAGYIYLEQGKPDKALEQLRRANRDSDFIRMLLARCYEQMARKEQARKLLQEIVNEPATGLDRALVYREARSKLASYGTK